MEKQKGKRVYSRLSAFVPWPHCLFDLSSLRVVALLCDLPLAIPLEYPFTLFRNIILKKKAGAESENHHLFDVAISPVFWNFKLAESHEVDLLSPNQQAFLGLARAPRWWSARPGMGEGGSRSAPGSSSSANIDRENGTPESGC